MNVNDSEILAGILEAEGFYETLDFKEADVIIANTCCVRETAERKAHGFLNELKHLKRSRPDLTIVVSGCMSQKDKHELLRTKPFIDLVLGPNSIYRLPSLLRKLRLAKRPMIDVREHHIPDFKKLPIKRRQGPSAYVSIIYGCNNFCSFCIVPYVRGREVSRPKEDIIREIEELNKSVFKEVVLLGQNVNSYKSGERGKGGKSDKSEKRERSGLAELLEEVHKIEEIERIRFLTSHPRDMSDDIIMTVKELPKVCEFFHLPIQSGDNEMLKKMNRGYTVDYYRGLVDKIRKEIPDVAITSDVVVGFPGETDEQFENTLNIIKEIEFDAVNTAAYSLRQGTAAAKMSGHLPEEVKKERLQAVMKVVEETAWKVNQKLIAKTVEVLVDRSGMGRTRGNKIVKFPGGEELIGKVVNVNIVEAKSWVLAGHLNPNF